MPMRIAPLLAILASFAAAAPAGAEPSRVQALDLASGRLTAFPARDGAWSSLSWWQGDLWAVLDTRRGAEVVSFLQARRLRLPRADRAWLAGDALAELDGTRLRTRTLGGRVTASRRIGWDVISGTWAHGAFVAGGFDRIAVYSRALERGRAFRTPGKVDVSLAAAAAGGRIAYAVSDDSGISPLSEPARIQLLDPATGAQTTLLRGTRCERVVLFRVCELLDAPSVSGDRLAVVRDLNGVTLLAPGGMPRALSPPADCDGVQALAWAPDGTTLAVAYHDPRGTHVALLQTGPWGAPPRTVADLGSVEVGQMAFSPDGAALALTSYQR
jgi:hypothetical protein